jgi:protein ImuA
MASAASSLIATMTRKPAIDELLSATPKLWKGRQFSQGQPTVPTGHARLDARLPGGGWPLGAVTELLCGNPGLGELSLLFPALAALGEQGQWVILIDPPWIPYPASLYAHGLCLERLLLARTHTDSESLWACEQALSCSRGGAVLAWPQRVTFPQLRRLQLAAEAHAKLVWLFRPEDLLQEASPAALRLHFEAGDHRGTQVRVLKCRGKRPPEPAWVPRPFSVYANHPYQNREHALARHPLSAPAAEPVYPGAERPEPAGCGERYH